MWNEISFFLCAYYYAMIHLFKYTSLLTTYENTRKFHCNPISKCSFLADKVFLCRDLAFLASMCKRITTDIKFFDDETVDACENTVVKRKQRGPGAFWADSDFGQLVGRGRDAKGRQNSAPPIPPTENLNDQSNQNIYFERSYGIPRLPVD